MSPPSKNSFCPGEVLVLDGGLSNELRKLVEFDINKEPLWTSKALLDAPNAVTDTHLAYLKAGADIIETCSYQASFRGFKEHHNLDPVESEKLMKQSVILAKNAINQFLKSEESKNRRHPLVAGSIGPFGAYLCDRSEFSGTYMDNATREELIEFHMPRVRCLIEEGVDFLLLETMPSVKEVDFLLEAIQKNYPTELVSVSFSARSNEKHTDPFATAYGDSVSDILDVIKKYPQVMGFGINCCSPAIVRKFLEESSHADKCYKRMVYPNKGKEFLQWHPKEWESKGVREIDNYANDWISCGAEIIGGCCEVGAKEISNIRKVVDKLDLKTKH